MNTKYKIQIELNNINNNIYYKNNPKNFLKLKWLIENYPKSYVGMLKANGRQRYLKLHPNYISPYRYLRYWIDDVLKNTKIADHKYPEKCYWIMHNMIDYNICQNINCNKHVTSFCNIVIGYLRHCNKRCAVIDPTIVLKREETNLKKYGVKYPAQNKEIYHKVQQTCLKKYGATSSIGSKYCLEKGKITKLLRYGDENYRDTEKAKQTKIKHFGTACSPSYSYVYNNISFDSSWELAYYIWLKDNNINFKFHPIEKIIKYTDNNGKNHIYTPDFWIMDTNEVIDIKGNQFFDNKDNCIVAYNDQSWKYLHDILKQHNIKFIRKNDIQQYLKYIVEKYGKTYLVSFKKSKNVK